MARYIQVYTTSRHYGGPEEGGWWYDFTHITFQKRTTKRLAKKLAKQIAKDVCEDVSGEVTLVIDGTYEVLKEAYRGRNRYSVLGGDDWTISVSRRAVEGTHKRPRYE